MCSGNYTYDIRLSSGSSGSYSGRSMANGGHHLAYSLYVNSTRTSVTGDGSSGTYTVSDGYLLGLLP
jgi:spore coat protein U-like protein